MPYRISGNIKGLRSLVAGEAKDILFLVRYASRHARSGLWANVAAAAMNAGMFFLGLLAAYLGKLTLDRGIMAGSLRAFLFFSAAGAAVFIVIRTLQYLTSVLLRRTRTAFSISVNKDLFSKFFGLDYFRIRGWSSSENSFMLEYDHQLIEELVFDRLPGFVSAFKLPVIFFLLCAVSWPLAVVVLLSVPGPFLVSVAESGKKRKFKARNVFAQRRFYSVFTDLVMNVKMLKAFSFERWATERTSRYFDRKSDESLKYVLYEYRVRLAADVLSRIATLAFWVLGGYLVIKGGLSFGSFSLAAIYSSMLLSEMQGISVLAVRMAEEAELYARCVSFLRDLSPPDDAPGYGESGPEPVSAGEISLRNVHFSYPSGTKVFDGLDVAMRGGAWTLVKGPSGSGKTTMLSLILRLFRPDEGVISFDGADIRGISKSFYAGNIAVALQEPYLLNDTVMNNVLLGQDVPADDLHAAVRCSKLDELAEGLPRGYNTQVGEGGTFLSGGERQRVALARALARRPKVLILDEAMSSVEPGLEKEIFTRVKDSFPGITVIYVTHRESSEAFADSVISLQGARRGGKHGHEIPGEEPGYCLADRGR